MITIRAMKSSEAHRISEIDRTERITQVYTMKDSTLEVSNVDWHVGHWDSTEKMREWIPVAEDFKNMWGAFEDEKLVGFVVYRSRLTDDMAQLALLHVSNGFRGCGIGKKLSDVVIEKARAEGKKAVYLTATPTKATVDFYLRNGFELAEQVNDELYALEPDDIHMVKQL